MLRKHRHQSEDERKLAVVAAGEIEAHRLLADRLGLGDLGVIGAMIWPAFIAQKLPGEDDVLGGDRFAVGELRGGVEVESDVAALGVGLDRTRDQPIKRKWLVIAASHQALDHVTADRRRRDALYDEGIEAVEGAEHALYQATALGCGGVGIGQVREALGQRRRAMHRNGVPGLGGVRPSQRTRGAANGEADEQGAASRAIASRPARADEIDEKMQAHGGNATRRFRQVFPPNRSSWGSLAWI